MLEIILYAMKKERSYQFMRAVKKSEELSSCHFLTRPIPVTVENKEKRKLSTTD